MTHEWMEYFRAPDTNIDKALQYPSMESNECISTCPDTKGVMTFCLWKVPITMTMTGFQGNFILLVWERLIIVFVIHLSKTNLYFIVSLRKTSLIASLADTQPANAMPSMQPWAIKTSIPVDTRSVINSANGRNPGYLDAPMLWFVHHHVTDAEGWAKTMDNLATKISKCENPSDVKGVEFEEGYGCPFSLMLGEKDVVCLWSAPEGTTREVSFWINNLLLRSLRSCLSINNVYDTCSLRFNLLNIWTRNSSR